ncbi:hypothetical protein PGQ11_009250 [Apiospora arundinis]|uniref:YDG domain-containing protein n=1 Tax=Apiospora arundinis TaxID=335852 RepID=A0ABR2IIJ1_9PEZI
MSIISLLRPTVDCDIFIASLSPFTALEPLFSPLSLHPAGHTSLIWSCCLSFRRKPIICGGSMATKGVSLAASDLSAVSSSSNFEGFYIARGTTEAILLDIGTAYVTKGSWGGVSPYGGSATYYTAGYGSTLLDDTNRMRVCIYHGANDINNVDGISKQSSDPKPDKFRSRPGHRRLTGPRFSITSMDCRSRGRTSLRVRFGGCSYLVDYETQNEEGRDSNSRRGYSGTQQSVWPPPPQPAPAALATSTIAWNHSIKRMGRSEQVDTASLDWRLSSPARALKS